MQREFRADERGAELDVLDVGAPGGAEFEGEVGEVVPVADGEGIMRVEVPADFVVEGVAGAAEGDEVVDFGSEANEGFPYSSLYDATDD